MNAEELSDRLESIDARDWEESPPEAGPVRFAMVGLGWWTRDKAIPAVERARRCETSVVVSGSSEKASTVAEEVDSVETGLTYEEFLDGAALEAYDAVYVCTPNARHLEFVESAVDHGKAVLCEKPMEASVERATAMTEAAAGTDVEGRAMVAYRMHTEPAVRTARTLLDEGVVGEPVHVHGDMSQSIVGWGEDQWRLDPALAGYGTSVMDLGIYSLNTTRFILGRDPVSVDASMRSDHEFFDAVPDEVAAFTVTFEDGVFATCTASQNASLTSHLRVVGTEGVIAMEPAFHGTCDLSVTVEDGTVDVETPDVDQMEVEFEYFADCLLADRRPVADFDHGLLDVRTLAAIYEAADRGETVRV